MGCLSFGRFCKNAGFLRTWPATAELLLAWELWLKPSPLQPDKHLAAADGEPRIIEV